MMKPYRGPTGVTAAPLAPLVGGGPITDISAAMKRIANFWPYPTTLFDYIRRSMPWQQPRTLTNDCGANLRFAIQAVESGRSDMENRCAKLNHNRRWFASVA